ncbi:conserved hypothetical protein [Theileria orientalis strain Shintoku]|uniref:Uncharacterized protein n=1 Tax=Theileria orientalis strain Shintoku TaxID=869250 RepID=J4C2W5_THEOR|nr:conserved hypothetical protein [Theileria orientalis strain Shintoku]PVC53332.1 hypothetical protein MACL_00000156 [Theileria orientalis]BAM39401.1 conserved hypothetical protein [Theileria orientalis strain Shintoku]|eukprot:XP_009689702.1 conserved hypothetical protein [Theileria orientalis strain Shintoku]
MLYTPYLAVALCVVFVGAKDTKPKQKDRSQLKNLVTLDLINNIRHIFSLVNKEGAAELSKEIIRENPGKGELLDYSYKKLKRSAFVGIGSRCICKYLTCNIPICTAACLEKQEKGKEPFDCLECFGECLPVLMRCLSGHEH